MFKYIRKHKYKKGFTFIELIVVIAVIALLVLLAAPRFIGKTNDAVMTQIKNDIRVVEGKLSELLVKKPETYEEWTTVEEEVLQDFIESEHLFGRGGPVQTLEPGPYREVDDNFINDINTQLGGDFYANDEGTIYYIFDKQQNTGIQPNTGIHFYANKNDKLIGSEVKEYDNENEEIVFNGPENLFDGDISSFSRSDTVITWEGNLTHRELKITGKGHSRYDVDLYFTDDNKNRINPIGLNTSYVRFEGSQLVTKTMIVPEGATQLHIKHEGGRAGSYHGYIYEIKAPDTLTRPSNINITHKTHLDSIEFKWDTVKRAYIFENGNFIKGIDGTSSKHTPKVLTQEYDIDILFIDEYGNGALMRKTIDRGNVSLATDNFGSQLFDNDLETYRRNDGVIQINEHLKHRELKITGRGHSRYDVDLYFTDDNKNRINPIGINTSYVRFKGSELDTKTMIVPEGATQLHIKHEGGSAGSYHGYIYEIKAPDTLTRPSNINITHKTHLDSIELKWDTVKRAYIFENGNFIKGVDGTSSKHTPKVLTQEYDIDILFIDEYGNGVLMRKTIDRGNVSLATDDFGSQLFDNDLETYRRNDGVIQINEHLKHRELKITGRGHSRYNVDLYFTDDNKNRINPIGINTSYVRFKGSELDTKTMIVPEGATQLHIKHEGGSAGSYHGYIYEIKIPDT